MEIANINTAESFTLRLSVGIGKHLLTSGDRVACVYYELPPTPDRDVMEGAHTHQAEAVWFIVDGELEVNIDGESAILKTGDAIITPYGAMAGSKVISTTPVKLLVVASPNILRDLPHAHETPESH